MRPCDRNILAAIKLADSMIKLADQGDAEQEDVGCGILYGMMLDSAYKIRKLAEKEIKTHQAGGWWDMEDPIAE